MSQKHAFYHGTIHQSNFYFCVTQLVRKGRSTRLLKAGLMRHIEEKLNYMIA